MYHICRNYKDMQLILFMWCESDAMITTRPLFQTHATEKTGQANTTT